MRRLVALLAVCLALFVPAVPAQAQAPHLRPLIVGGGPTTIAEHPWQVLVVTSGSTMCGGSLIASTWVLTAAHCVSGLPPEAIAAYAGITNLSQRSAENALAIAGVVVHPQATTDSYLNDVALIQLAAPWQPSAERSAIALPMTQDPLAWPPAGTVASITGWGRLSDGGPTTDQLQAANVQVLADAQGACGEYGTSYHGDVHLCAGVPGGGVDTCQGDSGGPLVIDVNGVPTLAGVTSVGLGCAQAAYPGIYTRTGVMLPWIRQVADIPVSPPAPPAGVTAVAQPSGKALVAWQVAPGDATRYTATGSPGGATCAVVGAACQVAGLTPGSAYTFTVAGSNALGAGGPSAASAALVAVNGTGRVGGRIPVSRIAAWAKVSSKAVRLVSRTSSVCAVDRSVVRLKRAGVCRVAATSGAKRGTAYIAVT